MFVKARALSCQPTFEGLVLVMRGHVATQAADAEQQLGALGTGHLVHLHMLLVLLEAETVGQHAIINLSNNTPSHLHSQLCFLQKINRM